MGLDHRMMEDDWNDHFLWQFFQDEDCDEDDHEHDHDCDHIFSSR